MQLPSATGNVWHPPSRRTFVRVNPISPILAGAALLAVACSRPSDSARDQEAHRDIRLIEEPSADKQTVSDLEAGKPAPRVALPEARTRSPNPPAAEPAPAPSHDHAAMMAALEPEATMKVVTTTEPPASMSEPSMPFIPGAVLDSTPAHWNYGGGGGGNRGPMILIRGGMGTERDDCKVHGVGGLGGLGGGGIAVNRVTPPIRLAGGNRSFSGGGGVVRIR
jgi:hypothetical protein